MADDVKLLWGPEKKQQRPSSADDTHISLSPTKTAAKKDSQKQEEEEDENNKKTEKLEILPSSSSSSCFSGLSKKQEEKKQKSCQDFLFVFPENRFFVKENQEEEEEELQEEKDNNYLLEEDEEEEIGPRRKKTVEKENKEEIREKETKKEEEKDFSSSLFSSNEKNMKRIFSSLFHELKTYSFNNLQYFQKGKQSYHARLQVAFSLLAEHIDSGIEPQLDVILPNLSKYDVCPEIPANGYRSLLKIIQKCCLHLLELCRHITINRDSVLFRIVHYAQELECYVTVLGQLRACLYFSCQLMAYCPNDSLFIDKDGLKDPIAFRLLKEFDSLSQDCFYGRCLGFQFCESMRKPLLGVVVALASFSEGYHETNNIMKVACSLLSSGKYILQPELRARQVVHVARNSDIHFCKSFWSLLENDLSSIVTDLVNSCNQSVLNLFASAGKTLVQIGSKVMNACVSHLPLLSGFMVQVNAIIILPPVTFELPARNTNKEKTVKISPPSVYTGASSVQFRLISSEYREGQEILDENLPMLRFSSKNQQPPSNSLLFHIHGGGFVSQSSKSHEVYLRHWARELKVPVISVDYSLAPENPFPRALEECFYVYAWALKNHNKLGWTGERICFAGDSAGGNLVLAVTIHAISCNIRVPDGILGVYTSVLISLVPSPSRLLSVMDPLLPVGVMLKCLDAYIGTASVSHDYGQSENQEDELNAASQESCSNESPQSTTFKNLPELSSSSSPTLPQETKDFQNNNNVVVSSPKTFLSSDLEDLFDSSSNSQSPSEKSDYSTPQGLSPVKNFTEQQTSHPTQDDWENFSETLPLVESDDVIFSQISTNQSPNSRPSIRQQHLQSSLDSGISINDTQSKNCDKSFVSEPNLELGSPSSSLADSTLAPLSHSVSTPAFHSSRQPNQVNFRRPHLTSFEPQNVQLALERFLKLPVIKNPLVSPIFASDQQLKMFPEISLVTCHFDPLLDDSVQLCKRMRQLGKKADLTVLEDLPHGFLNFALISKEAKQGSNICISKLQKLLQLT